MTASLGDLAVDVNKKADEIISPAGPSHYVYVSALSTG